MNYPTLRILSLFLVLYFALIFAYPVHNTAFAIITQDNSVNIFLPGFTVLKKNDLIVITTIGKDTPAEKAGLKVGDVLISLDGISIQSAMDFYDHCDDKTNDVPFSLIISRKGTKFRYSVKPVIEKINPTELAISKLLKNKMTVSLAIVVSSVKHTPAVASNWADIVSSQMLAEYESTLLGYFGNYDNFTLVDRSRLNLILDEFKLNQTGLVSDNFRARVGEMTGATHLIDISYSRVRTSTNSYVDRAYSRLIEIQSGRVLAVDMKTAEQ